MYCFCSAFVSLGDYGRVFATFKQGWGQKVTKILEIAHNMTTEDIRWKQRFCNYKKAVLQLSSAIDLSQQRQLSELEKQGLIQSFEYCHELAWNVLKDFFNYQGNSNIMGSRDATREAFKRNLIEDGEAWMQMIVSRNQTSHTYDEIIANAITEKIIISYYSLFIKLQDKMQVLFDING